MGMFQRALQEHDQTDARRKNVMLCRVPELEETDANKRRQNDSKIVEEVFQAIGAAGLNPSNIVRLGKFIPSTEGQTTKQRPIKVTLNNYSEAKQVMDKCFKLKDAPDHLKSINLSYEATAAERNNIRDMVAEAKKKSENNPNLIFKVRGPPWNPVEKEFKKQVAENIE